jgi:hypothetical protein
MGTQFLSLSINTRIQARPGHTVQDKKELALDVLGEYWREVAP